MWCKNTFTASKRKNGWKRRRIALEPKSCDSRFERSFGLASNRLDEGCFQSLETRKKQTNVITNLFIKAKAQSSVCEHLKNQVYLGSEKFVEDM